MPIPRDTQNSISIVNMFITMSCLTHKRSEQSAVAQTLHVSEQEMAKVVIVKVKERFVTTVLPATAKVDVQRLRKLFGTHRVRLATEEEITQLFPDCELGAMPPLGTLYGLPVYVDRSLTER